MVISGMAENAAARRFRRKVSCEMQVRLPAQTTIPKMRDRGGIGGQVFPAVRYWIIVIHAPAFGAAYSPVVWNSPQLPEFTIGMTG